MRKNKFAKHCPICNKIFFTHPSTNSKTCSYKCGGKSRRKSKPRKCLICNKVFIPKHTKSLGFYCSHKCCGIAQRKPFVYRNGYKHIFMPDHPYATKQGYYAQHRIIMENYLNRILKSNERVHHLNHIKGDNCFENLLLINDSDHKSMHAKEQIRKNGKYGGYNYNS